MRRRRASALPLVVGLPALLGGCGSEDVGAPVWSPGSAAVVFGGTREGRVDLLIRTPDGSERALVAGEAQEVGPRFAPDGRRLLFHARTATSPYHLYLATPEGVEALVAEEGVHAIGGVWSPDGSRVAYFSDRGEAPAAGGLPGHIWLRDLASGEDRRLTREPVAGTLGPSDWSTDGRWVLLARPFDGQLDVVRLEVETGEEERLTRHSADEYGAAFSSDGRFIAFHADTGEESRIVVLEVETGERRVLTEGSLRRYSPVWSPDDAWLLVNAEGVGGGQYDLVAVRVADGAEAPVVATAEDERYGAWLPEGSPWAELPDAAEDGGE